MDLIWTNFSDHTAGWSPQNESLVKEFPPKYPKHSDLGITVLCPDGSYGYLGGAFKYFLFSSLFGGK